MLARTIRQFVYGTANDELVYVYHKDNDVNDEKPIKIVHKSLKGKSEYSVSCSVCFVYCLMGCIGNTPYI
jgi:hypothetical protein